MGSGAEKITESGVASSLAHEKLAVFFVSIIFFLVIGSYTLVKEIKDVIFLKTVGKEYVPYAKVLTMFLLIPAIFFYAKLIDKIRRYQVLAFYTMLFGVVGLFVAFMLGHAEIGLHNTQTGPYRLFGWLVYFFYEGFSPFVVSVTWAFINSITSPEGAQRNYGTVVTVSKLGGMFSAGFAWLLFSMQASKTHHWVSDVMAHQLMLGFASALLIFVPVVLIMLMRKVPGRYLHGYEAAYQVEKQKRKEGKSETGVFVGLQLLFKHPYVLGIFCMVYFYEIINAVLSFLRLGVAESNNTGSIAGVTSYLFQLMFYTHLVGFVISLVGTRPLLSRLGERICLMLVPLSIGALLLYFMLNMTAQSLLIVFVGMKAIHYAFSWPVRESLYIPTNKEIKFKSKSWIDAFGSKFAKASGSAYNVGATLVAQTQLLAIHSFFFAGIVSVWFIAAYMLGRRFEWAVSHNEVIGAEPEQMNV